MDFHKFLMEKLSLTSDEVDNLLKKNQGYFYYWVFRYLGKKQVAYAISYSSGYRVVPIDELDIWIEKCKIVQTNDLCIKVVPAGSKIFGRELVADYYNIHINKDLLAYLTILWS